MKDIIYDEFGQRTKLSLGNGVVNEYTYDQNTRRLSHLKSFKGSNVFQNISYKFDAVGNILERVNKDFVTSGSVKKTSKQTYEYDNLYRLTSSEGEYTKESWLPYFNDRTNIYTSSTSYNRVGNITHKMVDNKGIYPELGNEMLTLKDTTYDRAYTYGGAQPHAVTKAGDLVMGYDDNGNMTSKEWTKYGVKMSMTWNSENRMTESVSQNIYSGAKTLTRYKYDHEGNRVVKSSNYGEVVTPSAEISYRNDSIVTKHIFVSGVRVASKVCDEKSSNTYYQSVDHLGSTNILTDAKGEFYEHIETFPDGSIWVKEYVDQSGVNTVFTSHEMDVETKFFYAKARYYDAQLGRFISVDPILWRYLDGEPSGGIYFTVNLNLYNYVGDNPVKYIDPNGTNILVLKAEKGAGGTGHTAGLVQNDKREWVYFSRNGENKGSGSSDLGKNPVLKFKSIKEFFARQKQAVKTRQQLEKLIANNNIKLDSDGNPDLSSVNDKGLRQQYTDALELTYYDSDSGKASIRYEKGLEIATTRAQDKVMMDYFSNNLMNNYYLIGNNCKDLISRGMNKAGIKHQNTPIAYPNNWYESLTEFYLTQSKGFLTEEHIAK